MYLGSCRGSESGSSPTTLRTTATTTSCAAPIVEGFVGPMPLRRFLLRYFFLRWMHPRSSSASHEHHPPFRSPCDGAAGAARHIARADFDLVTAPLSYHVLVYVALGAPPPPQTPRSAACMSVDDESRYTAPATTAGRGCSVSRPEMDVLATLTDASRPLSRHCIRRHTSEWSEILRAVGPSGVGFILGYTTFVAQFECGYGSLELFGVSLARAVPEAPTRSDSRRRFHGNTDGMRRRSRSDTGGPATWVYEPRRPQAVGRGSRSANPQQQHAARVGPLQSLPSERGRRGDPLDELRHQREAQQRSSAARIRAASEAARVARRSNLSRMPLCDDRCWSDGAACCLSWAKRGGASLSSTTWEERDIRIRGLVKDAMATRNLFRGYTRTATGECSSAPPAGGGVPRRSLDSVTVAKQMTHDANVAVGAARRCATLHLLEVLQSSDVVDSLVFPASLLSSSRRVDQPASNALPVGIATAVSSHDGIRAHLFRVVRTFLVHLILHTDVRGAALAAQASERMSDATPQDVPVCRHVDFLVPSNPMDSVVVPVSTVVSFLRRVLGPMTWSPPSESTNAPATTATTSSAEAALQQHTGSHARSGTFWCRGGVKCHHDSTASRQSSRPSPLEALLVVVGQWLAFGKRGSFPLHTCLHGVGVNLVPWLSSCRVVPSATTAENVPSLCDGDAATRTNCNVRRNKRRSEWQQLVWAEFCRFLFTGPIPWLVRAAFHVAWSPKQGNGLVYCYRDRWNALVRKEVRGMIRGSKRARPGDEEEEGDVVTGKRQTCKTDADEEAKERRVVSPRSPLLLPRTNVLPSQCEAVPLDLAPVPVAPGAAKAGTRGSSTGRGLGLSSALGRDLLYASLRLLPDGRKLRPISTIRVARRKSLENLTIAHSRRFARERRWKERNRRAWARHSAAPRGGFQLAVHLRRRCRNSFLHAGTATQDRFRFHSFSASTPPNKTLLRDVLRVLICGQQELRRAVGDPAASASLHSHTEEYASWRMYVRTLLQERSRHDEAHCLQGKPPSTEATEGEIHRPPPPPLLLHVVRSDASRCFDRLPQKKVLEAVQRLVPHEAYAVLQLDAVMRISAPAEPLRRDSSACLPSDRAAHRRWSTVVHVDDFLNGRIPQIPPRWVICEPRCFSTMVPYDGFSFGSGRQDQPASVSRKLPPSIHVALTVGDFHRRFQTSHVSSWLEWVDGATVRDVLREHLQDHLVVLNGRVFRQRSGIIQGSAVSTLLCDQLFCELDQRLCDTLEMYGSPALVLRRVDDVLVASGSPSNVAAMHCVDVLQRGCTDLGYYCNADKMLCSVSAFCPHSGLQRDVLTRAPATVTIPWCGLLWNTTTLEFSIDWRRYVSMNSGGARHQRRHTIHRSDSRDTTASNMKNVGGPPPQPQTSSRRVLSEADLYLSCLGALRSACLRAPLTVFCAHLNSPGRMLQTLAEMVLLWSDVVVDKLHSVSLFCRPHLRLLLRCVSVAQSVLWKHMVKRDAQLRRSGSRCAVMNSARLQLLLWDVLRAGLARQVAGAVARYQSRLKPPSSADPSRSVSPATKAQKTVPFKIGGWSEQFWYRMIHVCRSRLTMLLEANNSRLVVSKEEMATIVRNAADAIHAAKTK